MPLALLDSEGEAAGLNPLPQGDRKGWLRWLLLALWLPLALAAAAAPIMGPIMLERLGRENIRDAVYTRVGLFSTLSNLKPFSEEALDSGLRAGDTVIAIDGRPLARGGTSGPSDELATLLDGPDGTIHLTARSPDGTVRDHRLTRTNTHYETFAATAGFSLPALDWFFYIANIVYTGVVIAAAALLFVKGGQRPIAGLLALALTTLCLSFSGVALLLAAEAGIAILRFRLVGWSLMILALMLFPDGRFYPPRMRGVAVLLVVATPIGIAGLATGLIPVLLWFAFHVTLLVAAAASLILRYRRLPAGVERQQIRWATFGFSLAVGLLLLIVINEGVVQPLDLDPQAQLWSLVLDGVMQLLLLPSVACGVIVSLLRYRLYDADRIIARSASFGALALLLVALFAGTEKIIELLGEEWFGERLGVLAGGIGAALAALMIVPLHHRLSHWAEHRFRKQLIQLRQGLPALVGDLRETAPPERIATAALDWVTHGVRASRAALLVGGEVAAARGVPADEVETWRSGWQPSPQPGLDAARDDALFPLRVPLEADGHGRVGWLLLGPRPDGSFYGKDERETLSQIADPLARALEIAQTREAREAAERERWRGQESVNAELVRILGALDQKLEQLVPAPAPPAVTS